MNKPYPGLDILCYTKIGQNLMLLCFVKDFAFVEQYKYQITVFANAYYAKFVSLLICIKIKFMLLIQCFDLNNNNAIFPVSVSFKCPSVFLPVVLMFVLALRQPRYPDLASAARLCCSLVSLQHLCPWPLIGPSCCASLGLFIKAGVCQDNSKYILEVKDKTNSWQLSMYFI